MSTRCQIEFSYKWKGEKGKTRTDRRTVYRHQDGYPQGSYGVLAGLKEFISWNGEPSDVEYAAANFIYWSKKRNYDYHIESSKRRDKTADVEYADRQLLLGFGVCENDELHGDIQYFYKVIVKKDKLLANEVIIEWYNVIGRFGKKQKLELAGRATSLSDLAKIVKKLEAK